MEIVFKSVKELIPYVNNTRTHTDEQVNQVASSIKEFGFTNPVLIDNQGGIIAGHCRVLAAGKLNLKEVPCIELSHLTEAQKKAYIIADNKLALNAGWNEDLLKIELESLKELDFDLDVLGFDDAELESFFNFDKELESKTDDDTYTKKIEAPIYEPKGEKPSISELLNTEKAENFIKKIKNSNVTKEEKEFLINAAKRHFVFNYESIANYYAHSEKEMQELMEESALVIIDFNKAIENGYIRLSEKTLEEFSNDYGDFDDE